MENRSRRMLIMFFVGIVWVIVGVAMYLYAPDIDDEEKRRSLLGCITIGLLCFVAGAVQYCCCRRC